MFANASDTDLVQRAKQGDLDAFEELTTRYERQIYSLARRILGGDHDAQDVTQITFISVVENLKSFGAWQRQPTARSHRSIAIKARHFEHPAILSMEVQFNRADQKSYLIVPP